MGGNFGGEMWLAPKSLQAVGQGSPRATGGTLDDGSLLYCFVWFCFRFRTF